MKNFVDEVVCIEAALKEVYKRTSDSNFEGHYHVGFEVSSLLWCQYIYLLHFLKFCF